MKVHADTGYTDKILVVGPSWVGDMVMSQVLYQSLAQSRPGVIIDVLAPAWSAPLLQRMPEVRRAVTMPVGHGELGLPRRWQVARELRAQRYTQAIVLPNSLKSALIPALAGIPTRTGWRGEWRYGLLSDLRSLQADNLPLMAQRFYALGHAPAAPLPARLPTPRLTVARDAVEAVCRQFSLAPGLATLALCPGAEFGAAKRWPTAQYAQLAQEYLQRGWRVVLFGSLNDQSVCVKIAAACGDDANCYNLAGKTSLGEVVDLLSACDAVVSNDSGLMHIAAALRRPLLALYGPTSPRFTPPLSNNSTLLQSELDCAPCFARECPLSHHRCMTELTSEHATQQLDRLLASDGVTA